MASGSSGERTPRGHSSASPIGSGMAGSVASGAIDTSSFYPGPLPSQQLHPPRPGGLDTRSVSSPPGNSFKTLLRRTNSTLSLSQLRLSTAFELNKDDAEWTVFRQLLENQSPTRSGLRSRSSNRTGRSSSNAMQVPALLPPQPAFFASPPSSNAFSEEPSALTPAEQRIAHEEEEAAHAQYIPASEDYDSDDSQDSEVSPISEGPKKSDWRRHLVLTSLQRNILKCAVAYLLASLFTFNPWLSSFISDITSVGGSSGPSPSGHMIATVSVYFNPAKTLGGMFEADVFCVIGLAYAGIICLGSMSMFWFFETKPGWEWFADVLVCVWIAGAMSVTTWAKVWMNKPSFNTACSMCSIILFIVIVKEGGWEMLQQVSFNVAIGAVVSNLVCFLLWPRSATANLRDSMTTALDSFSTLLQMLTRTFLLQSEFHAGHQKLIRAVEAHQASFTSLKSNLQQAHSEWLLDKRMQGLPDLYDDAVDSLNRLAQHLAGLRSGTQLQYELSKARKEGKIVLPRRQAKSKAALPVKLEGEAVGNGKAKHNILEEMDGDAVLAAAAVMFGDLVDDVGPPLAALSSTCTMTLERIRTAFLSDRHTISSPSEEDPHDFEGWADKIERSLYTFERTSNHALMRIYRRTEQSLSDVGSSRQASESVPNNDQAGVVEAEGHNETVFLVYFFIFTLQEFAHELQILVDIMSKIYDLQKPNSARRGSLGWFRQLFSCCFGKRSIRSRILGREKKRPGLRKQFSNLMPLEPKKSPKFTFPKMRPHVPGTVQTPSPETRSAVGRFKFWFWKLTSRVREQDIKFAFKVGVSTAILAAPAFIEATRPIFTQYRGEWALISFFVVMGQTIGATNFLSVHRILGTILGAVVAVLAFSLFTDNPAALAIFGFFFSIPCFYYIVATPQYATSGRFVLLTYNLTCLFCYNTRHTGISVINVAFHRSVAVTVGVLWALVVSQFWWPSEARRELSKELGDFLLNIGWLYNRLVFTYSIPDLTDSMREPASSVETPVNERTSLLSPAMTKNLNSSIRDFMSMELHLQIRLIHMQKLLAQTQNEPRLKGPFPIPLYRSILTSLQRILDLLHSMRCVTTREEWYTSVRRDFIIPVTKERREMVGNIMLYFAVLSSAFRLKAPLPPYLPPAEQSRQRLVDAIRNLDVVKKKQVQGSRQLLYFAYALMMKGVIQELDYLGRTVQDAFGVIGQSREEFEALFNNDAS